MLLRRLGSGVGCILQFDQQETEKERLGDKPKKGSLEKLGKESRILIIQDLELKDRCNIIIIEFRNMNWTADPLFSLFIR